MDFGVKGKGLRDWKGITVIRRVSGCSDSTVPFLLNGRPNITFLGLGCRFKSAVDRCHMMCGFTLGALTAVHTHVLAMAKPIAMLKNAPV